MQVTIVGGGVIGLCCAYYLQKQGHEVTVIDRNTITDGCSFGNMGYISPSHFMPIASPGIIKQGLKWMMSSSSPFYIKPRLNLDLISWGLTFRKNARADTVKKNAPHLNNLLQLSRELMNDLKAELPGSFSMIEKGCWALYKTAKTEEHEKHLAEQAAGFGLRTLICNHQQVQDHEPEVELDVAGGVLYLDDCHLDSSLFMRVMHQQLKSVGVKFLLETDVTGFEKKDEKITALITDKGRVDCGELILANGSWMGTISKLLGIKMLMQPGKGYSMVYNDLQRNLKYPSILIDDRTATSPIDRWLRIGGTMELSGHNDKILPKRVMALYNAFRKYYPKMELSPPDINKAWYGYRPVTPDGLPYIGRHKKFRNLSFAGGHAMLGLSAAAATGLLMKEVVGGEKTTIDISAFDPQRFS